MSAIAGKSCLNSIDLCDFYKRQVCSYFVDEYKKGGFKTKLEKLEISKDEMFLIIKFRTEWVTLERLLYLKDVYLGENNLTTIKLNLLNLIGPEVIGKLKTNQDYIRRLKNKQVDLISIDYLVQIIDMYNLLEEKNTNFLLNK